ncbi:MAG TPA: universal stress protein [Acidimicrobiales bacterium]|nr:universal stress protein [Acidimicrobiales bacterium]
MGRIVVGVDGSEHAAGALRWARREARLHGHELTAVLAWGLFDQLHAGGEPCFDPDYGPADAAAALAAAVERAVGADAAAEINQTAVCDLPARALLNAAQDADMLVVGPRGLGRVRGLLLGSVSQACLHHAPCPIAVVHGGATAPADARPVGGQSPPTGRIVVGVDGSEVSGRALSWALAEARVRGATVEAVHGWHVPYALAFPAAAVDLPVFEDAARHLLDRMVDAAEAHAPGVPIRRVLVEGAATEALLDAAKNADLLVVGSRGVGGFRGLLVGSVSYQLAHYATCPAVVVPPEGPTARPSDGA